MARLLRIRPTSAVFADAVRYSGAEETPIINTSLFRIRPSGRGEGAYSFVARLKSFDH